jgi:endonuclease/exonuclease/phosphatase family metal-dependent hydrolase
MSKTRILQLAFYLFMSGYAQASFMAKIAEVPQELAEKSWGDEAWTVAAWNLQWFPGQRPREATAAAEQKQIKAVRKILLQERPTILFASEVRSLADLKKLNLEQVSWACTQIPRTEEEGLGMHPQGLALISRVPWEEVWAIDFSALPAGPDRPYRGILGAQFKMADGEKLYLYGVHLKSNRGNPETVQMRRERAMDHLRWDWKRRGIDPQKDRILLVGDFNTSLNMSLFQKEQTLRRLLGQGFVDAAEGMPSHQRMTLPASRDGRYPPADFDQILVSAPLAQGMGRRPPWARVVRVPTGASDHYLMKIKLK